MKEKKKERKCNPINGEKCVDWKSTFPLGKEIIFGKGLRNTYLKRNVHFYREEYSFVTLYVNTFDYSIKLYHLHF